MVAAPQFATMIISNGQTSVNVDVYASDVANSPCTFDSGSGAAAGALGFFKSPISGRIVDFSILTGMTDTTAGRITINNSPCKSVIRWANQLNTLNSRPALNIPVAAGENIGIVQLA